MRWASVHVGVLGGAARRAAAALQTYRAVQEVSRCLLYMPLPPSFVMSHFVPDAMLARSLQFCQGGAGKGVLAPCVRQVQPVGRAGGWDVRVPLSRASVEVCIQGHPLWRPRSACVSDGQGSVGWQRPGYILYCGLYCQLYCSLFCSCVLPDGNDGCLTPCSCLHWAPVCKQACFVGHVQHIDRIPWPLLVGLAAVLAPVLCVARPGFGVGGLWSGQALASVGREHASPA
jgi:hypothetical protein